MAEALGTLTLFDSSILIVEPEPQGFVLVSIYDPWTILGVHHL